MGANLKVLRAALWAANVVVWGCVYLVDRNLKSERKRLAEHPPGTIIVDLNGEEPIQVAYQKKVVPEFTIYQV